MLQQPMSSDDLLATFDAQIIPLQFRQDAPLDVLLDDLIIVPEVSNGHSC